VRAQAEVAYAHEMAARQDRLDQALGVGRATAFTRYRSDLDILQARLDAQLKTADVERQDDLAAHERALLLALRNGLQEAVVFVCRLAKTRIDKRAVHAELNALVTETVNALAGREVLGGLSPTAAGLNADTEAPQLCGSAATGGRPS